MSKVYLILTSNVLIHLKARDVLRGETKTKTIKTFHILTKIQLYVEPILNYFPVCSFLTRLNKWFYANIDLRNNTGRMPVDVDVRQFEVYYLFQCFYIIIASY